MAPPATDRDMLNRIFDNQERSQREISEMKSSVAVLVDDRARAAEERKETRKQIQGVQDRVETVERAVTANTVLTANVQQDVAEMSNNMSAAQEKLHEIERVSPVVMAAIVDVAGLKEFRASLEKKEQRVLGWWDIIQRIGWIGWTVICGIGAGGVSLLFFWLQRFL